VKIPQQIKITSSDPHLEVIAMNTMSVFTMLMRGQTVNGLPLDMIVETGSSILTRHPVLLQM